MTVTVAVTDPLEVLGSCTEFSVTMRSDAVLVPPPSGLGLKGEVPSLPPPPLQAARPSETSNTNMCRSIFIVKLTLCIRVDVAGVQRTAVLSDTTFGVRKINNSVFVEALVFVLNR